MTVREIVETYLTQHGYDGLRNEEGDCGCLLGDFMDCGSPDVGDCEPAYKKMVCEGGWVMVKEKPEEKA